MSKLKAMDKTVIIICSVFLLMKIAFACILFTDCGGKGEWGLAIAMLVFGQFIILKDYMKERHNYN